MIVASFLSKKLRELFRNWEYVVLSRMRTLQVLYLLEPINMHDTFEPSDQFKQFVTMTQRKLYDVIKRRTNMIGDLGMSLQ